MQPETPRTRSTNATRNTKNQEHQCNQEHQEPGAPTTEGAPTTRSINATRSTNNWRSTKNQEHQCNREQQQLMEEHGASMQPGITTTRSTNTHQNVDIVRLQQQLTLHVRDDLKQDGGYISRPEFNGTTFAESRYRLLTSSQGCVWMMRASI